MRPPRILYGIAALLLLLSLAWIGWRLGEPRRDYQAAEKAGRWAVVAYDGGSSSVWTTSRNWRENAAIADHRRTRQTLVQDRQGRLLGWGYRAGNLLVWTDDGGGTFWGIEEPDCRMCVDAPVPLAATSYRPTEDGSGIAVARSNGEIALVDIATRSERIVLDLPGRAPAVVALSPDERWLGVHLVDEPSVLDALRGIPPPGHGTGRTYTAVRLADGKSVPLVRAHGEHQPAGWVILAPPNPGSES